MLRVASDCDLMLTLAWWSRIRFSSSLMASAWEVDLECDDEDDLV